MCPHVSDDNRGAPPMARPRVAAGALFLDTEHRILLVKPKYKDGWDLPGGYVEPDESPRNACTREIREELGIHIQLGRLLTIDWAPSETDGDKLLFIFGVGQVPPIELGRLSLQAAELSYAGYHQASELDDLMPARLARRIHAALAAHRDGTTAYLEHGYHPGAPQQ